MDVRSRPYYHEFAWAYDLLQTDAVAPRVDFIQQVLNSHGIGAAASIIDAGCGTGRYADELVQRGFQVCGVDRSPELVAIARSREPDATRRPTFVVADLLEASFPPSHDVVLCRGVLNDFVDDWARSSIFHRFAKWLRPGGVLIFDVREWSSTVVRYTRQPTHRRTVELPDGDLHFHSETVLEPQSQGLRIRECFEIQRTGARTRVENDFAMRCWTSEDVAFHLQTTGLDQLARYPAYGESDQSWSDRIVVVARKPAGAADTLHSPAYR
jgi:SAM-dependent methyltransferase